MDYLTAFLIFLVVFIFFFILARLSRIATFSAYILALLISFIIFVTILPPQYVEQDLISCDTNALAYGFICLLFVISILAYILIKAFNDR